MTIWMTYAILLGALAVGGAVALEYAARAVRVPTRFVWLGALIAALVAPAVLPFVMVAPRVAVTPVEFTTGGQGLVGAMGPASALPTSASLSETIRQLDRPLTWLWLALTAVLFLRLALGAIAIGRKRRSWSVREVNGTPLLVTLDMGPAVVAMPAARIIVPEWVLSLDASSLATVVRHERQHAAAGDVWLIVSGAVAVAVMPWNPAVWFMRRRLRLAVEMDCDARVLAEGSRVDRYGALLLAIAQHPRVATGLGATLAESRSDLERRIDAMTARVPRFPRLRAAAFAAVALVAIFVACALPAPDVTAPKSAPNATTTAQAKAAEGAYLDFQVEHSASANASNTPPQYPARLRAAGIEGSVVAKFVVDTNGSIEPRTFEVIRADHPDFVEAVRNHLPQMRFFPARVGGRAVRQLVQMPFMFSVVGRTAPALEPPTDPRLMPDSTSIRAVAAKPPAPVEFVPRGDTEPSAVATNKPPMYPPQLRAANIEGKVEVSFTVLADGTADMSTFKVLKSDHDAFTAAVRTSLAAMRFHPAMRNGQPVAAVVPRMPFQFSLVR